MSNPQTNLLLESPTNEVIYGSTKILFLQSAHSFSTGSSRINFGDRWRGRLAPRRMDLNPEQALVCRA